MALIDDLTQDAARMVSEALETDLWGETPFSNSVLPEVHTLTIADMAAAVAQAGLNRQRYEPLMFLPVAGPAGGQTEVRTVTDYWHGFIHPENWAGLRRAAWETGWRRFCRAFGMALRKPPCRHRDCRDFPAMALECNAAKRRARAALR